MSNEDPLLLHLVVIREWMRYYVPYTVLKDEIKQLGEAVPELQMISASHGPKRREVERTSKDKDFDPHEPIGSQVSLRSNATHALESIFERTDSDFEFTLAASITCRRERLAEVFGHGLNATFSGGGESFDTGGSFASPELSQGRAFRSPHHPRTFHMSVTAELSGDWQIWITGVEYRVHRLVIQERCKGVTPEGFERFETFEALDETEPGSAKSLDHRDYTIHQQANIVFRTLHEVNFLFMTKLRAHVEATTAFYQRKSLDVSGSAFVLFEATSRKDMMSDRDRDKLQRMFRRLHFTVQMLQEFCDHNHLIVTQLVEKFFSVTHQHRESSDAIDHLVFYSPPKHGQVASLEQLIVAVFADAFCDGDAALAVERLKLEEVKTRKESLSKPSILLQIGLLAGAIIALGGVCIVLFTYRMDTFDEFKFVDSSVFMFAVSGVVLLLCALFALNVVVWEYFEVNFVYSLHLNPLRHFCGVELLRDQMIYVLVWVVLLFCHVFAALQESSLGFERRALRDAAGNWLNSTAPPVEAFVHYQMTTFPSWVWAYCVFPCLGLVSLAQFAVGRFRDRWLLRAIGRIIVTPYFSVEFPDFFICEQLVTLSTSLWELQYIWCQFHSDAVTDACAVAKGDAIFVLLVLPSLWRLLQSLRRYHDSEHRSFYPHLLNATKYLISCLAITCYALTRTAKFEKWSEGESLVILVLFLVFSSVDALFKCCYELWTEMGVLRPNAKFRWIRDEIFFPQWTYYAAAVIIVLLRFLWVIKYLSEKVWFDTPPWAFPVFSVAEVLRRAVWNLYRVEHDQVSNIESYKVVRFAPALHHDLPTKALWDFSLADLRGTAIGEGDALEFFVNVGHFFKAVSRQERQAILQVVVEPGARTSLPALDARVAGVALPEVIASDAHTESRKISAGFVRDPRSGLVKTTLMHLLEMSDEDKFRALYHRMRGLSLSEYLKQLVLGGHLDETFVTELKCRTHTANRVTEDATSPPVPPRRVSSHNSQGPPEMYIGTSEDSGVQPPVRQISRNRRATNLPPS
jgi:hypothetical protein